MDVRTGQVANVLVDFYRLMMYHGCMANTNGMNEDKPIWLIYKGAGIDSGFGDYSEPVWDEEPVRKKDGSLLWFDDKQDAEYAANLLSNREIDSFYAQEDHGTYEGVFPTEFRAFKSYIPACMSGACKTNEEDPLDVVPFIGEDSHGYSYPLYDDGEEQ